MEALGRETGCQLHECVGTLKYIAKANNVDIISLCVDCRIGNFAIVSSHYQFDSYISVLERRLEFTRAIGTSKKCITGVLMQRHLSLDYVRD